jgi:integrase
MLRSFVWLQARLGPERPIGEITKRELARFRDDLIRLDGTLQGRKLEFEHRLTNIVSNQIKSVTAKRYWQSVRLLFKWAVDEGFLETDNSGGLVLEPRKGEQKRSPPPFSTAELHHLCLTPLYSGYKSRNRLREFGCCRYRSGHWWSGVLLMHTGLRAGELSQLLATDFVFDEEIPHLKVREEDDTGRKIKRAKTQAALRDVPLHPNLLELGLREFVAQRKKTHPDERLFVEFRLEPEIASATV